MHLSKVVERVVEMFELNVLFAVTVVKFELSFSVSFVAMLSVEFVVEIFVVLVVFVQQISNIATVNKIKTKSNILGMLHIIFSIFNSTCIHSYL